MLAGVICAVVAASPSRTAELGVRATGVHRGVRCGRCGCLGVAYVYHRELRSTYGLSFDPRNYDTTEPYYYFGRVRAYPRYFVVGGPPWVRCRG